MSRAKINIRPARDQDVPGILEVFRSTYGNNYPYAGFTDIDWLKRAVFNDNMLMLVAEEGDTERVLGTASVVFDIGANSDLIGEFGRLAVLPECRGKGIGSRLMKARIDHISDRLHVAVVENRTPHNFSQRISQDFDFAPVGFLPLRRDFGQRESIALFARYFGGALELRRNNPRVVPEALELAHKVFNHCGLPFDVIVDEASQPYPHTEEYRTQDLTAEAVPALIRIERGRIRRREIFGPMRLQYGLFRLSAKRASYLVALQPAPEDGASPVAGAIGYIHDSSEQALRVFELIAPSDHAIRFLFGRLLERCRDELDVQYMEIDVSAYAPRMQRTLVELGFLPVAYVPAMVFHRVERLDVIKMAQVLAPPVFNELNLTPGVKAIADVVIRNFQRQAVLPEVADALNRMELLAGLSNEQSLRVASVCAVARFAAGTPLFVRDSGADCMFVLIKGEAEITQGEQERHVGQVGAGESLGEISLLMGRPHSATATARSDVTAALISRKRFEALVRQRPDIGTLLYRNLAMGLGRKLHRLDQEVASE